MTDIPEDVMAAARKAMNKPFNQSVAWEGPLIDAIAKAIMAERARGLSIVEAVRVSPEYSGHHADWICGAVANAIKTGAK